MKQLTQKESVTRLVCEMAKTCAEKGKHFTINNVIYLSFCAGKVIADLEQDEHNRDAEEILAVVKEKDK